MAFRSVARRALGVSFGTSPHMVCSDATKGSQLDLHQLDKERRRELIIVLAPQLKLNNVNHLKNR